MQLAPTPERLPAHQSVQNSLACKQRALLGGSELIRMGQLIPELYQSFFLFSGERDIGQFRDDVQLIAEFRVEDFVVDENPTLGGLGDVPSEILAPGFVQYLLPLGRVERSLYGFLQ